MPESAAIEFPAPPTVERLHYLDVARAVLLLLGIPYHAAQPYSSRAWFIHSETYSRIAELAGGFSHAFRMHAFFLVAGYFATLIVRKRGLRAWLADRARRLIIPFLAMLLIVLPAQAIILGVFENGGALGGLVRMREDLRLWVAHSWFLRDLFLYCAILAFAWPLVSRLRWQIGSWQLLGAIVGALLVWKLGVNLLVAALVARIDPIAAYDLGTFLRFLPLFAIGALIAAVPGLLASVTRYSGWGVALAVVWLGLSALLIHRDDFGLGAAMFLGPINGLVGSWALIAVARRFLDKPSALVDYFVASALIIYIVHLGFIFLFTGLLRGTGVPPTLAWLLVSALTLAGCVLVYEGIRRVPALYFLFNGQARRAPMPGGKAPSAKRKDDGDEALA